MIVAIDPRDEPGKQQRTSAPAPLALERAVPGLLLVLGAAAASAPYASRALGFTIDVSAAVEVLDHVVPGAAVLGLSARALWARSGTSLASALACVLAGFWITMTHVGLLVDPGSADARLAAALIHAVPGLTVLVVAIVASVIAVRGTR